MFSVKVSHHSLIAQFLTQRKKLVVIRLPITVAPDCLAGRSVGRKKVEKEEQHVFL